MVAYFRKQNRLGNPLSGVDGTFYLNMNYQSHGPGSEVDL